MYVHVYMCTYQLFRNSLGKLIYNLTGFCCEYTLTRSCLMYMICDMVIPWENTCSIYLTSIVICDYKVIRWYLIAHVMIT